MEMRQDTKTALAWELLEAGVPKGHIAERLEISRRSVIRWAQGFQKAGSLTAFLDSYHQAKRGLTKVDVPFDLVKDLLKSPCHSANSCDGKSTRRVGDA